MSRQDMRLLLLGLTAALLLGGGGALLILAGLEGPPPQQAAQTATPAPPAPAPPAPVPAAPAKTPAGPPPETIAARGAVEQKIAGAPDVARFFDRLRLTLPGEYDTIVGALARKTATADTPDVYLSEAVKSLRQSRGALAAKADAPALAKVFAQQLAVLNALSGAEPRLCVDFLYGGASDAFFAFSASHRSVVADLAIAGLDAILDGKEKSIARGAPNEADFQLFEAALRKAGLAPMEIDALLDGKTPDPPLPDPRMCAAGQVYLQTLAALPDPARLRIYALAIELMARS